MCGAVLWYNIYISKGDRLPSNLAREGIYRAIARNERGPFMAISRQKNNIVNLSFGIMNEDGKAGLSLDQAIINGRCAAVSVRAINGGRKSAAGKLEREALEDLAEALQEILGAEGEF